MTRSERITFEQIVIGSILKNAELFLEVLNLGTNKEAFSIRENSLLFAFALEYFYEYGKAPNIRSLNEHLHFAKADSSLIKYFSEQIINAEYTLKAPEYVRLLIDDNINSEVDEKIISIRGAGFDRAVELNEAISGIITKYTSSYSGRLTNAEAGKIVYDNLLKASRGEHSDYIPTGFETLDKDIIGIPKRDLTVIASRPGMGKTQFMLSLLKNFRKRGVKCGIFSLEMGFESLWHRNLAAETGIDALKIERGSLSSEEMKKLRQAVGELCKDDYIIDDNGHQTPESIKANISLWKANNSADVVIVDYLTLIDYRCDDRRNDLNIGKLTNDLRRFAKKSGVPIILLSQLNRAVETRVDKRPLLSDLRESGNIEQDATLVMFLYRPGYYGVDPFRDTSDRYMTQEGFMLEAREYAEVIVRKARNGVVGVHPFRCILNLQRFEEVRSAYQNTDAGAGFRVPDK
ncbi:MAG: DnaB-like helicase C-terminal domain-containing protein [archaeon]